MAKTQLADEQSFQRFPDESTIVETKTVVVKPATNLACPIPPPLVDQQKRKSRNPYTSSTEI